MDTSWRSSRRPSWEKGFCSPTTTSGPPRKLSWPTAVSIMWRRLPNHEESLLRGLGTDVSLDRSKDPRPCSLLRDGPDSGRVAAPRSPPRRPGSQSRGRVSGTVLDLRSHQSLCLDFREGGPPSCGHHVHRADTDKQTPQRNFSIECPEGALVTTPVGVSDRLYRRTRLDVSCSCSARSADNPETWARVSELDRANPHRRPAIFRRQIKAKNRCGWFWGSCVTLP